MLRHCSTGITSCICTLQLLSWTKHTSVPSWQVFKGSVYTDQEVDVSERDTSFQRWLRDVAIGDSCSLSLSASISVGGISFPSWRTSRFGTVSSSLQPFSFVHGLDAGEWSDHFQVLLYLVWDWASGFWNYPWNPRLSWLLFQTYTSSPSRNCQARACDSWVDFCCCCLASTVCNVWFEQVQTRLRISSNEQFCWWNTCCAVRCSAIRE